jgi:hypothetical protein
MIKPGDYKAARQARKRERDARLKRRNRLVPFLRVICKKYGIRVIDVPGGYQFRSHEYIITWWPSYNRISIQYPGSGEAVKFECKTKQSEPKIFAALRKLIAVTRGAESSEPLPELQSTPSQ